MSNEPLENRYTTTLSEDGVFTRVEMDTGRTWKWMSRTRPKKPLVSAKNGVSIAKLEQAGFSVRVKHFRLALYLTQKSHHSKDYYRAIVVPSVFRKLSPIYQLLPKGGYTHITIKLPSGGYICVSSECVAEDPFCYRQGVAKALEKLSPTEVAELRDNGLVM